MMERVIKWNEGEGNIVVTYSGKGNDTISIAADANEGIDRVQEITLQTADGGKPKSATILVTQEGLREVFEATDGAFILNDGGTFNVLK